MTDEPVYYEAGAFGVPIEDQMLVEKVTLSYPKPDAVFLRLRSLTMVPYNRKLIARELLTKKKMHYINQHYTACLTQDGNVLKDFAKTEAYRWLVRETTPQ